MFALSDYGDIVRDRAKSADSSCFFCYKCVNWLADASCDTLSFNVIIIFV